MTRLKIEGAHLIDAERDYGVADLYLHDGVIEGMSAGGPVTATIAAHGLTLCPAFIDLHAHLREPGQEVKEDLASGLAAAAAGGFGTVVSMANTQPTIDEPGLVAELIAKAAQLTGARLRPAAALSRGLKGEALTDFAALKAAGAVMVTDDGMPVVDSHLMRRACEYAAELGLIVQTHAEDPSLRQNGVMHEGAVSQRLGLPGNPDSAEAIMIFRDCELAAMTGARVHIAHLSSRRGLAVIDWFKQQGAPVTAEVTPHHLTLTDAALASFDPIFKVAPPLRTEADVAALISALQRGLIDCIATDHAPHTRAEKEGDLLEAPFGIANLEVCFPLLYTALVKPGKLELKRLIALLTSGPARVMGWPSPRLTPGSAADLVLFDPKATRPVTPQRFVSKAKFSPWEGWPLAGWPVATLRGGELIYDAR